ncbi:putative thioredoxin [Frankineae bacterium MT45]|nr:putative thioredoxin [Frankineae bacterium MT45]
MAGAVDLAAVKARSEAAARAAEAPPVQAGSFVSDVDEASFQAKVLDRSFQVPVLLDLYSTRSQLSAELSPLLMKLANEAGGSWLLGRIDVDVNPRIAQALQLQGVPAVYAIIGGQPVPGFEGALPEPQVREFIAAVLHAAQEAGLPGVAVAPEGEATDEAEVPEPSDPRFVAAEDALNDGDFDLAAQRYQAILDAEPANSEATLALRQVRLFQRLAALDPALVAQAELEPTNVAAGLAAADAALAGNDVDAALARLLALVKAVSADEKDEVRTRLLEYFDLLGPDDPRVAPARRELGRALF